MGDDGIGLPPGAFGKDDEGDDAAFYAPPRLVTHIDAAAIAALTAHYRRVLPPDGRVLDLMSSWVSHLPPEMSFAAVVGHGMNEAELAANPRLTSYFIRNLNRSPDLPEDVGRFDAALCCVGVQYLQQPVAVFGAVRRALRAGAPCIASISNRCFPTKAVAIWHALDDRGRAALVATYLETAGFVDVAAAKLAGGRGEDPLIVISGNAPRS